VTGLVLFSGSTEHTQGRLNFLEKRQDDCGEVGLDYLMCPNVRDAVLFVQDDRHG